jgi:hypothetical protein
MRPHVPVRSTNENGWIVVRSQAGSEAVTEAVLRTLQQVDPKVTFTELSTMTGVLGDSLWRQRFAALLVPDKHASWECGWRWVRLG